MTPGAYNLALGIGVLLVGAGVAAFNLPAALIVVGALVLGLTVFSASLAKGS